MIRMTMMSRLWGITGAGCLFLMGGATNLHADWPQWRGPHRNGQIDTPETLTKKAHLEEIWNAELGTGFSSVAIAGERVLASGNADEQDTIWCLNLKDGKPFWKHSYSAPLDPNLFEGGPTATPTIDQDSVYTISRAGKIFCFDLKSGDVRWHVQVPEEQRKNIPSWGYSSSPLVLADHVYFNAGAHGLCLDAATGNTVWASDNEEVAGYTSPVLMQTSEETVILLESEKSIWAIRPDDGTVVWRHPWITRYGINAADPLVLNDHQVVVTSGYSKGAILLDMESGSPKELWRTRNLRTQMSPGVLVNGYIYANDGDADRDCKLVCIEAETGALKWLERGYGSASVIRVGPQLLVLSEAGELMVMNPSPEKLDIVAKFPILTGKCWTPPAWTDSQLLARNAAGHLVCVRLMNESATGKD